jgi:hypothetical protein
LKRRDPSIGHKAPCENAPPSEGPSMDIERINAIGANLADLTERTQALRGYL